MLVFKQKGAPTGQLTFNLNAMHRRAEAGYGGRGASPSYQGKGWAGKSQPSTNGWRWPVDVVFEEPDSASTLYAAKPEDLTRYLLLALTRPGDYILDHYAGSGTTLKVAYFLGRRSSGIEASPRAFPLLQANIQNLRGTGAQMSRRGKWGGNAKE
jgi:DNA modification methylase